MKKNNIKRLCTLALMIALAFAFSYLESLIPFNFGIPGIKLGIANLVVIVALYTMNAKDALFISIIRILLSGLAFSGPFAMIYSLIGGLLSFLVMFAAKKSNKLSPIGVSALGGTVHNFGQILVAAVVMQTYRIIYYFPILMIVGLVTGILNGIIADIIIKRIAKTGDTQCQ